MLMLSSIVVDIGAIVSKLESFALGDPDAMSDFEAAALLAMLDAELPDLAEVSVWERRPVVLI